MRIASTKAAESLLYSSNQMKNTLIQLGSSTRAALVALAAVGTASLHATTLDLTAVTSGSINGAQYIRSDAASTGTGVIQSFVRVQNNGTAEGYNADARPVMPDVNTSPTFTKDIQLSALPIVNGAYEFLLDINQQSASPFLSLDEIQIYTRSTPLGTANTLAALTGSSTLRYDMDGAGDSHVRLDYNLNSGSGSGDMFLYVPTSLFGANTDYVYLYSLFGAQGGIYAENDGFEEWAYRTAAGTVPDGGTTALLLGSALLGLALVRRRLA